DELCYRWIVSEPGFRDPSGHGGLLGTHLRNQSPYYTRKPGLGGNFSFFKSLLSKLRHYAEYSIQSIVRLQGKAIAFLAIVELAEQQLHGGHRFWLRFRLNQLSEVPLAVWARLKLKTCCLGRINNHFPEIR